VKLPGKKIIYYSFGLTVVLLVSFVVGYQLEIGKDLKPDVQPTPVPSVKRPPIVPENYTKEANVIPLGQNLESENKDFKAQIKGSLEEWDEDRLKIDVNGEVHEVIVPQSVRFYCMKEFIKGRDGNDLGTSEVFVDLRNVEKTAVFTDSSVVKEKILVGEIVTVQVTYDIERGALADLIMGYGC
jgi:hypothetical protein